MLPIFFGLRYFIHDISNTYAVLIFFSSFLSISQFPRFECSLRKSKLFFVYLYPVLPCGSPYSPHMGQSHEGRGAKQLALCRFLHALCPFCLCFSGALSLSTTLFAALFMRPLRVSHPTKSGALSQSAAFFAVFCRYSRSSRSALGRLGASLSLRASHLVSV